MVKGSHSIKKKSKVKPIIAGIIAVIALVCIVIVVGASCTGSFDISSYMPGGQSQKEGASNADDGSLGNSASSSLGAITGVITNESYTNPRYGFTVEVPEGFVIGSEIDNGSGIDLSNDELQMRVIVSGSNNVDGTTLDSEMEELWNKSNDSIARVEDNHIIIYQYDNEYEYFYWVYVGEGTINQMDIRYPVQDDNIDELSAAQTLMEGFTPGNLNVAH